MKQFQLTLDMEEKDFGKDCWKKIGMILNDARVFLLYKEYDELASFNAKFFFERKQIGTARVIEIEEQNLEKEI